MLFYLLLRNDMDVFEMLLYATKLAGHKVAQEGFGGLGDMVGEGSI